MADFFQNGLITTLHELRPDESEHLVQVLENSSRRRRLGLILPVTAADMQAEPFGRIVQELQGVNFVDQIVVALGVAPDERQLRETLEKVKPLGDKVHVLWTDGPGVQKLYGELTDSGLNLQAPGKGRSVWTAYGFLLADRNIEAFVLHDCDIVNYDRSMLARLCLPMAHPALDFDFCKAYYARYTDRLHGRVCRLLVTPVLRSLMQCLGTNRFLVYLDSFRYPLSGEFAVKASLALSNRIPSDWGLEIGTLAEVYRNTSLKRVCQVELCHQYEHKHQELSVENPSAGLMKMAADIMTTLFRTLAAMGTVIDSGLLATLRAAYLRTAQDAIRQYHADAVVNGLTFDRHQEEEAVEGFCQQIITAGDAFCENPVGGGEIPNWARVLAAFPDVPQQIRGIAEADRAAV